MQGKGTIHIVNDRQLCDEQYANYRERLGSERGYQAGIEAVVEWIEEQGHETFRTGYYPSQEMWKAQKKVWGIKEEANENRQSH